MQYRDICIEALVLLRLLLLASPFCKSVQSNFAQHRCAFRSVLNRVNYMMVHLFQVVLGHGGTFRGMCCMSDIGGGRRNARSEVSHNDHIAEAGRERRLLRSCLDRMLECSAVMRCSKVPMTQGLWELGSDVVVSMKPVSSDASHMSIDWSFPLAKLKLPGCCWKPKPCAPPCGARSPMLAVSSSSSEKYFSIML